MPMLALIVSLAGDTVTCVCMRSSVLETKDMDTSAHNHAQKPYMYELARVNMYICMCICSGKRCR